MCVLICEPLAHAGIACFSIDYRMAPQFKFVDTKEDVPAAIRGVKANAANGGGIHFFGVEALDHAGLKKLCPVAPLAAVHKGMPPFLCIHGTKDDQVLYERHRDVRRRRARHIGMEGSGDAAAEGGDGAEDTALSCCAFVRF